MRVVRGAVLTAVVTHAVASAVPVTRTLLRQYVDGPIARPYGRRLLS